MTEKVAVRLPSSGKTVLVPVDKDGYVPESALVEKSKSRGSIYARNDYDKAADIVLPSKITPREVAPWWENMDKYDVEGIDVKGKPRSNIGSRTGKNAEIHRSIKVYGTVEEEKQIRKMIDESFSMKDKEKLISKGPISVNLCALGPDLLGSTDTRSQININRLPNGMNNGTVVHEGSHMLRRKDEERKNPISRSSDYLGIKGSSKTIRKKVSNIEESCTVAEQLAREQDNQHISGYYSHVPVKDKKTGRWRNPTESEIKIMARQDRKLFREGSTKPLTERKAVESVNKNWAKSHIARLRTGDTMAINDMATVNSGVKPIPSADKKKASKKSSAVKKQSPKITTRTSGRSGVLASPSGKRSKTKQMTFTEKTSKTAKKKTHTKR